MGTEVLGRLNLPGEILALVFDHISSFKYGFFLTLSKSQLEPFAHQQMYELICLGQW